MGNKKSGAEIIRLAKPMKKGFLRLIFSRFLIILSLLLLQVGIGLGFFWWITEYVPYLHIFRVLFTAAMVIYLFNNSMDSTAISALYPDGYRAPGTETARGGADYRDEKPACAA